uniref:Uncharacterized protein n=1 Tax=Grammatophora oceanica TaxID=210454 RepID=A0A6U5MU14_9STRA|mmetsp:Transcript_40737/g.60379  ORF Transcript_40737/g.60379 Transcript_40737/m.60379 type:complete len:383 (+) Transcript_40737:178-1326(+)
MMGQERMSRECHNNIRNIRRPIMTSNNNSTQLSNRLFEATKRRNLGEVRRLIEHLGADPTCVSEKGQTVLHAACHSDCFSIVKYLVSTVRGGGVHVESRDGENRTPLLTACYAGRTQVARYLVEKGGADVNARDNYMCTPLHYACSVELSRYRLQSCLAERQEEEDDDDDVVMTTDDREFELVKFLVEVGRANVQAQDNSGIAPLHIACFYGCHNLVRYLVEEQGANVNVLSFKGTPFHHACRWRRTEVIRYLVSKCPVDAKILKYAWAQPDSLGPRELPWSLKAALLESYVRERLGCSVYYARTHPIHVILQCPLPSEYALFDCMKYMDHVFFSVMDEYGRLPLHVALTLASTINRSSSSSSSSRRTAKTDDGGGAFPNRC